jgi:PAS domain-containing protein
MQSGLREDAVEEQLTLAKEILDQADDAVIFAYRSGTIRRWNRGAAALFGFAAEEGLGQSLDLIVPVHLRTAHWRGFDRAMKNALKLEGRPTLTWSPFLQVRRRLQHLCSQPSRRRTGHGLCEPFPDQQAISRAAQERSQTLRRDDLRAGDGRRDGARVGCGRARRHRTRPARAGSGGGIKSHRF